MTVMTITDWPEPLVIDQAPQELSSLEPDEAWFNKIRTHRYLLTRRWASGDPMTVIGLNPSKANALINDPTIGRVIKFARREGCGWVRMLNIYGLKSTDPAYLREHLDPVGPCNDLILKTFAQGLVVVAWGANPLAAARVPRIMELLAGIDVVCLGVTASGAPKHPLARGRERVPDDAPLIPWRMP